MLLTIIIGKKEMTLVSAVCGGYLTSRRGELSSAFPSSTSGTYAIDADCAWVIEARPGRTLEYRFLSLDVRSDGPECEQDRLVVRNGPDPDSPFVLLNRDQGEHQNGRLCRSTLPRARNTSTNFLRVELKANGDDNVGSGFR